MSIDVGFVVVFNDVVGILLIVFVSFYGIYGNKIKWFGYGLVIIGKGKNLFYFSNKLFLLVFVFIWWL